MHHLIHLYIAEQLPPQNTIHILQLIGAEIKYLDDEEAGQTLNTDSRKCSQKR